MAYRRRQGQLQTINTKPTTSEEEEDEDDRTNSDSSSSTSLAAKAIRASSAAHRDSSLSSAYGFNIHSPSSASPSTVNTSTTTSSSSFPKDSKPLEYTSMKNLNESSKQGFWGTLARKAKSFIDDENDNYASPPPPQQLGSLGTGKPTHHVTYSPPPQQLDSLETGKPTHHVPYSSTKPKYQNPYPSRENYHKTDSPKLQKGLNAISSSLNYIGNAVEEGLTIVESRTADIIQETRKHIRKKPSASSAQNQATNGGSTLQQHQLQTHMQPQIQTDQELQLKQTHMQPQIQTDQELQLKASRDVAMAMAAKAKLLLRELKTVKADLAFAKERCGQLEEENKILREHRERGDSPEDDDMIRLQLETLLSEKARLAHENSVYARENRFLREVVEYHQLTMQDVVYLDESTEEVTEVYPIKVVSNAQSQPSLSPEASLGSSLQTTRDIYPHPVPPPGLLEVPKSATSFNLNAATNAAPDTEHNSSSSG